MTWAYEQGAGASEPATKTEPSYTTLEIGPSGTAGQNGDFDLTELRVFSGLKYAATLFAAYNTEYPELRHSSSTPLYINFGDSLTTTFYAGTGNNWTRWAYREGTAVASEWLTISRGGFTLLELQAKRKDIQTLIANTPNNGTIRAVVFAGTNDIHFGADAATTLSRLKTFAQNLKADGVDQVVVVTPLPRYLDGSAQNLTFEPIRQTLSDSIMADVSGDFAGKLDVRTLAIGVDGEQNNTTYYVPADYVHLNATGEQQLGEAIKTVLQAL